MLNFHGKAVPIKRLDKIFNELKDWIRISPQSWIVYTELSAADIRNMIKDNCEEEDPTIIVIPSDIGGWAVYAKQSIRSWLKENRGSDLIGR